MDGLRPFYRLGDWLTWKIEDFTEKLAPVSTPATLDNLCLLSWAGSQLPSTLLPGITRVFYSSEPENLAAQMRQNAHMLLNPPKIVQPHNSQLSGSTIQRASTVERPPQPVYHTNDNQEYPKLLPGTTQPTDSVLGAEDSGKK